MNVALITAARMNSQRYPGKCLAPFRGKPLIQHTIDLAKNLGLQLFVHTRDELIIQYVGNQCPILYEPQAFVDKPKDFTVQRMAWCNKIVGASYLVLLQSTHPLREPARIREWIRITVEGGYVMSRSVMEAGQQLQDSGSFYAWSAAFLLGHYKEPRASIVELQPVDLHTPEDFARNESEDKSHS